MFSVHHGDILGPLWITKGERFRPSGSYLFLDARYKEFRAQRKLFEAELREILYAIQKRQKRTMNGSDAESSPERTDNDDGKSKENAPIRNKQLLSMSMKELKTLKEVQRGFYRRP